MPGSCSIRALWIINNLDVVIFSGHHQEITDINVKRFRVVEKQWQATCKTKNESSNEDIVKFNTWAWHKGEGSTRRHGISVNHSAKGSNSWVDDLIMLHIISLCIDSEREEESYLLWPLILHVRGPYFIVALPLVEPRHLKVYLRLCSISDCGNALGVDESISSLLPDLPAITGAFMVALAIGDIIIGDVVDPKVFVSVSPSVRGQLDSLIGSIGISGISSTAKRIATPIAFATPSITAVIGVIASNAPKIGLRPLDKDALQNFISRAMPFDWPLDLNHSSVFTIKVNGFSSLDLPPSDLKQLAWKPYLYKGQQRILFIVHEIVHAAMILPLSDFFEDEGAFLFKVQIMKGYKAPLTMEFCNVTMPFPRRRVVSFDGTPSVGAVSKTGHSVEWKIIPSGRNLIGKSIEATLSGTIRFAPLQIQRVPSSKYGSENMSEGESDIEAESANNMVNVEEFLIGKTKDLPLVDLKGHFAGKHIIMPMYGLCLHLFIFGWFHAFYKTPKFINNMVSIYPAVKAPMELSTQVISGDCILWNTLRKCPSAATA
ncbi:hypothetical protein GH714_019261 [Hevea brasiliensis]|uniref:MHD domain-containing protein n=1 Tax=Hevea brasiliensis TaxID=3981 RepID=A0A6A6MBK7_HEVBR|nr:hypothetical protein GH714_019261 [Hevea brasiliensis]